MAELLLEQNKETEVEGAEEGGEGNKKLIGGFNFLILFFSSLGGNDPI